MDKTEGKTNSYVHYLEQTKYHINQYISYHSIIFHEDKFHIITDCKIQYFYSLNSQSGKTSFLKKALITSFSDSKTKCGLL